MSKLYAFDIFVELTKALDHLMVVVGCAPTTNVSEKVVECPIALMAATKTGLQSLTVADDCPSSSSRTLVPFSPS